ncbi:MAG TPA: MarR family transcriptional regulator [Trebonia sp.]|nr:MarR family transcriptional regulator [Trebonia sp.]
MTEPQRGSEGLTDALAESAFMTMAVLSKAAADNDLSLTQLRVLGILRDRRLRISALAGFLGLEKSTLSGLVDRAEKRGLLARVPAPDDGRAVEIVMTPAGAALAERFHADIRAALGPRTSALTPAEQRRLQGLLEKMLRPNGLP